MIIKFLQNIFAHPWAYNALQLSCGLPYKKKLILENISTLPQGSVVLDIGGGTGIYSDLWPQSKYLCLDLDKIKLLDCLNKNANSFPLLGNATCLPIKNKKVDLVLCSSLSHHLSQKSFNQLIYQTHQVLKQSGYFLFIDAVKKPKNIRNTTLWRIDRGEFPKTEELITDSIEKKFKILNFKRFQILYDFIFIFAQKN